MDELISNEQDDVDCCRKEWQQINERLPVILENRIMKEFLQNKENEALFYKTLERLDESNIKKLDVQFKAFYRLNRILRYLNGLIKRYPIDYDKRVKLRNNRYQLLLDKPVNNGEDNTNVTLGNLIVYGEKTPAECVEYEEDQKKYYFVITNPVLYEVLEGLEPKQHQILYLYYEKGFNNKEIGKFFGQTEQNISYWHKKTLKQIKDALS